MRTLILVLTFCLTPIFGFATDAINKKLTPRVAPSNSKININSKINPKNMKKLEFSDSAVFEDITLETDDQGYWYYNIKIKNTGKGIIARKKWYFNCSECKSSYNSLPRDINEGQTIEFQYELDKGGNFPDEALQCSLGSRLPMQDIDKKFIQKPHLKNKVILQDFTFNKNSKRWKATVQNGSPYTQLVSIVSYTRFTTSSGNFETGRSKKIVAPGQTVNLYAIFMHYRDDVIDLTAKMSVQKYYDLDSKTIPIQFSD